MERNATAQGVQLWEQCLLAFSPEKGETIPIRNKFWYSLYSPESELPHEILRSVRTQKRCFSSVRSETFIVSTREALSSFRSDM
jgi:hypothetical protein